MRMMEGDATTLLQVLAEATGDHDMMRDVNRLNVDGAMDDGREIVRRILMTDNEETRSYLIFLAASQMRPDNFLNVLLHYMGANRDDATQEQIIGVISTLMTQLDDLVEADDLEEVRDALFVQLIYAALDEEMPGTGRGFILALVVEAVLHEQYFADLSSLRMLVEESFSEPTQEMLLGLLHNTTEHTMIMRYSDEAQRHLALFVVRLMEQEPNYEITWAQINLLMNLHLAFYVDGHQAVLDVAYDIILTYAIPRLSDEQFQEMDKLLLRHSLSETVGRQPHSEYLEYFLMQGIDLESPEAVLMYLGTHYIDQVRPGLSRSPVIHRLIEFAIAADLSSLEEDAVDPEQYDGSFYQLIITAALTENLRRVSIEDAVEPMVEYVLANTDSLEIDRAIANYSEAVFMELESGDEITNAFVMQQIHYFRDFQMRPADDLTMEERDEFLRRMVWLSMTDVLMIEAMEPPEVSPP